MSYSTLRTNIEYNKEYNHGEGYTKKELDQADKKSMMRTRKGLMIIKCALDYFYDDYKIGYGNAGKMTDEEVIGFRECSHEIEDSILEAIEELDLLIEDRGFLPKRKA